MIRRLARICARIVVAVAAVWLVGLVLYRWIDPPATPLMLIRLATEPGIERRLQPLSAIAPALAQAAIAAEDNRFCVHAGIDWLAVEDAFEDYEDGTRVRGASTITMQTARNLFLWPGGGFARKAVEAPLAIALDLAWPKRRIIEVYLNIAEWGRGIYGAEAAARRYFGKPAARLSQREAALMVAVLPNPRFWNPARPTAYILRRADIIERRIGQLGSLLSCLAPPASHRGRID